MTKKEIPASKQIDQYIDELSDWRGEMLTKIRNIFHQIDPEIIEEWKWMGSPAWSHEGLIAVGNAHKKKVKLTFNQGVHLEDPHGIFNAGLGGKKWRAIDLFEGDELDEEGLKLVIQDAIEYNLKDN